MTTCKACDESATDSSEQYEPPRLSHTCGKEWPQFVNVYEVRQVLGGVEEGGWYYDVGEPLSSIVVNNEAERQEAEMLLEKLFDFYDQSSWDLGRQRGRTSAAGGYDISIYVEDHFAEYFPQRRPHYE